MNSKTWHVTPCHYLLTKIKPKSEAVCEKRIAAHHFTKCENFYKSRSFGRLLIWSTQVYVNTTPQSFQQCVCPHGPYHRVLASIREKTGQDCTWCLQNTLKQGGHWAENHLNYSHSGSTTRTYWFLLMKGGWIVIPETMQVNMLDKIH